MKRYDETISATLKASQALRDLSRTIGSETRAGSTLDQIRSNSVQRAIAASDHLEKLSGTAATLATITRSSILSEQMKSVLTPAVAGALPAGSLTALGVQGLLRGRRAAGDLGIGHRADLLPVSRRSVTGTKFATCGAVADALESMKALRAAEGTLAGLFHDRSRSSTGRRIQSAFGVTGAVFGLNGLVPTIGHETFARATQWSIERSVVGGAMAAMARNSGLRMRERSALMDGATRTMSASFRTIIDGTIGASSAGLRPPLVSAYAGLHRGTLPIIARASGFALPVGGSPLAGHLADHLAKLERDMSALIAPVGLAMAASREADAATSVRIPDRELIAVATEFGRAMEDVASTGTLDALLHFLDRASAAFARNTARELEGMGALTLLPLLVAVAQIMFWLQPAWTPAPEPAQPPGIERVQQELHALSEKLDALTGTLARQEAANLEDIPRVRLRRNARVRTGPGMEYPDIWRLQRDEVVGARDRENGWVLVFYRDHLSGALGSGWVYEALLDEKLP